MALYCTTRIPRDVNVLLFLNEKWFFSFTVSSFLKLFVHMALWAVGQNISVFSSGHCTGCFHCKLACTEIFLPFYRIISVTHVKWKSKMCLTLAGFDLTTLGIKVLRSNHYIQYTCIYDIQYSICRMCSFYPKLYNTRNLFNVKYKIQGTQI